MKASEAIPALDIVAPPGASTIFEVLPTTQHVIVFEEILEKELQ